MNISGCVKKNVNLYNLARKFRREDYEVIQESDGFKINLGNQKVWFWPSWTYRDGCEEIKIYSNEKGFTYFKLKFDFIMHTNLSLIYAAFGTILALLFLLLESSFYELLYLPIAFLFIFLSLLIAGMFVQVLHCLYLWIYLWVRIKFFKSNSNLHL